MTGELYKAYSRQLGPWLEGTMRKSDNTEKEFYIQHVWAEARARSIVKKVFTSKRGSVYTSMRVRFMGKANKCS